MEHFHRVLLVLTTLQPLVRNLTYVIISLSIMWTEVSAACSQYCLYPAAPSWRCLPSLERWTSVLLTHPACGTWWWAEPPWKATWRTVWGSWTLSTRWLWRSDPCCVPPDGSLQMLGQCVKQNVSLQMIVFWFYRVFVPIFVEWVLEYIGICPGEKKQQL